MLKKARFILFPILVILFNDVTAQFTDSLIVKHFDPAIYRANAMNYMGVEAEDGTLYFANDNGLLEFDGSEWHFHVNKNFSAIYDIKIGKDGKIYTAGNNDLGYFERDQSGVLRYTSLRDQIKADSAISFYGGIGIENDKVYFQSYAHVYVWDQLELKQLSLERTFPANLDGRLIFSSSGKGIGFLEGDTVNYVNSKHLFKDDTHWPFIKKPDGKFLAFTLENGIYELDVSNDYEMTYWDTEASELSKKQTYDAILWRDSLVVVSSSTNYIFIMDFDGNVLRTIKKEDGLPGYYTVGIFEDRNKNLWVTTNEGIVQLRWEDPAASDQTPETIVRYYATNDTLKAIDKSSSLLVFKEINSITFFFATKGYLKDELNYSTFLEGFDKDWQPWKQDTKKEYTNLSPGKYLFKVKSLNNADVESTVASVEFEILAPWHQTWWFYSIILLTIIGLITAGVSYRTAQLKAANARLEKVVNERTLELTNKSKELETAVAELKITNAELDNFVYRSSHDLVAPLKSLRGLIQIAEREKDEAIMASYFGLMNKSVTKLEEFIKSIMEYSINSKRPVERVSVSVDELIENVMEDLTYYENIDKIRIIKDYPTEFTFHSDLKRLKIIFSNLITNSVKYHDFRKEDPYVKISAKNEGEYIIIDISDNGMGIDKQHQGKIYDMFFRATDSSQGSGLGLYIVKDTISLIDGEISLHSEPRLGTTFTIKIKA